MFTGIVEELGTVAWNRATDGSRGGDVRVRIEASTILDDLAVGDSVSVSGCCLTAVAIDDGGFEVELSSETLARTAPRWQRGARVNLERAMPAAGRFGGHVVSGHVEAVGQVLAREERAGAYIVTVRAPERLARYLIPKGSVTVDGVSLTVVDVGGPGGGAAGLAPFDFTLWLIPHTLLVTTLGDLEVGDAVNLEADLIAKYVERMTLLRTAPDQPEEATHVPRT